MAEYLHFTRSEATRLEPYLPPRPDPGPLAVQPAGLLSSSATAIAPAAAVIQSPFSSSLIRDRPFVTLTFATSLDSSLSLAPGVRTRLSGPESKAMTHYLRSRHDAILVGVGTAVADDPGLNCRLAGLPSQPRPIIVDPNARWTVAETAKVLEVARAGQGKAPFILTGVSPPPAHAASVLAKYGGKFISLPNRNGSLATSHLADSALETTSGHAAGAAEVPSNQTRFAWDDILEALQAEGLHSVMIEGGGSIINSLLDPSCQHLIDAVIVTIAPTWLGQGGVVVSPARCHDASGNAIPAARLVNVEWIPLGEDVVLCGNMGPCL